MLRITVYPSFLICRPSKGIQVIQVTGSSYAIPLEEEDGEG